MKGTASMEQRDEKWVDTKQMLPPYLEPVLVWNGVKIGVAYYGIINGWVACVSQYSSQKIVAWRHLPPEPSDDGHEHGSGPEN